MHFECDCRIDRFVPGHLHLQYMWMSLYRKFSSRKKKNVHKHWISVHCLPRYSWVCARAFARIFVFISFRSLSPLFADSRIYSCHANLMIMNIVYSRLEIDHKCPWQWKMDIVNRTSIRVYSSYVMEHLFLLFLLFFLTFLKRIEVRTANKWLLYYFYSIIARGLQYNCVASIFRRSDDGSNRLKKTLLTKI